MELKLIENYIEKLKKNQEGKIAVLFSGGIDSALVAYAARNFADAITIDSEFTFRYKIEDAINFAKKHKINHKIIKMHCLDEKVKNNPFNRCYFCKMGDIKEVKSQGYNVILDGTNIDDLSEYRPGLQALKEEKVISPLVELNVKKEDVIKIMQEIDIDFSSKPHESCIASRIPFNSEITIERLRRIEKAENYIRNFVNFVRVRDYFPIAKIEVLPKDIPLLTKNKDKIEKELKKMGYENIIIDLYKQLI